MRLAAAFLADSAQVQGGKLYVLGGGFSTITVRKVPAVHRQMSLVLLVEVENEEWGQDLDLGIKLVDEDGKQLGVDAKGKLRVGESIKVRPGDSATLPMVSNFVNMAFPEAKGYGFIVTHDESELARVRFRVIEARSTR